MKWRGDSSLFTECVGQNSSLESEVLGKYTKCLTMPPNTEEINFAGKQKVYCFFFFFGLSMFLRGLTQL